MKYFKIIVMLLFLFRIFGEEGESVNLYKTYLLEKHSVTDLMNRLVEVEEVIRSGYDEYNKGYTGGEFDKEEYTKYMNVRVKIAHKVLDDIIGTIGFKLSMNERGHEKNEKNQSMNEWFVKIESDWKRYADDIDFNYSDYDPSLRAKVIVIENIIGPKVIIE